MKVTDYKQCLLKRKNTYRVGWIPVDKAVKGKLLKLKLDDKWSNGWEVVQLGITQAAFFVEAHEMDYKKQRKASDI